VARVRPGIERTWMLNHDNTPCHTAISINKFLAEKNIPVVPQPLYSPDLSPCDFLFPQLKNHLKGHHFGILDNMQKSVTDELKGNLEESFQHCYQQWKQRLHHCVAAQGKYIEDDNLQL
jgi:transposase